MQSVEMTWVHELNPTTLLGGVLYWLTTSTYLIVFDNMTKALFYVEWLQETHGDLFK
jgi:hypothetical protein